jgi:TonB family protein
MTVRWTDLAHAASRGIARENAAVIAGVVLLHVLFLWVIALSLRTSRPRGEERELQVRLLPVEPRAETPIRLPQPTLVASIPTISFDEEQPSGTIAAASSAMVLAPRPDPGHPNPPPTLVALGAAAKQGALDIMLRILVLADGSISDAKVLASSGQPDMDAAAIGYVKANWRFIPAMLSGTAVEYWTTIRVKVPAKEEHQEPG